MDGKSRGLQYNKLFQSFNDPKYKQKDESKYRIWWYSRNSSKTKVSYQQPQLQRIRRFFQVSIRTINIKFDGIEFIINPRINGEALPLTGSCKIHGNSKESLTQDMRKVWYFYCWEKFPSNIWPHQCGTSGTGCKPGHLCPEIYKALDGILFIAETKKQHEEKMRVR